jgi:hypothetical protein
VVSDAGRMAVRSASSFATMGERIAARFRLALDPLALEALGSYWLGWRGMPARAISPQRYGGQRGDATERRGGSAALTAAVGSVVGPGRLPGSRCRCARRARRRYRSKRNGYSITSSASAISLSGMFKLSVFAVMRLMTNSNFVGCTTGQIGGLFTFEDATSIDADQPVHRHSHHFQYRRGSGDDRDHAAENFFQGGNPKQATPLTAPATPSPPEIVLRQISGDGVRMKI